MEGQEGIENGNAGAWFNKNNFRDFELIFDPAGTPPAGYTRARPLEDEPYQRYDEAAGAWVADPQAQARAETAAEAAAIKAEIAARDYRALKAMKLGQPLDALYPGESAWYAENLARLQELEAEIAASAAAV